jgi:hypothetical protein
MAVFPIAGILWISTLTVTAPFFGGRRIEYSWAVLRFSVTSLPLAAPGPLMAYLAGGGLAGGFSLGHMIDVALRRGNIEPWFWLTALYLGLGGAALIWQILLYVKVFDIHGQKAWQHYLVSAILLIMLASGLSTLASLGLGAALAR